MKIKLTTTQRRKIIIDCTDRASRVIEASRRRDKFIAGFIRAHKDEEAEKFEKDYKALEALLRKELLLPDNLHFDSEECMSDKSKVKSMESIIKKLLRQHATEDEIDRLYWEAENQDEIDLGWVVFAQPLGYYSLQPGPLWGKVDILDALKIIGGIQSGENDEAVFAAIAGETGNASSIESSIESAMRSVRDDANAMHAIRELLGSSLNTESLQ